MKNRIQQIEHYVQQSMSTVTAPDLRIAHDFKHVDRVRNWALRIASAEVFHNLELMEATALLHDIGLVCVKADQRKRHAEAGAEIAGQFLHKHQIFSEEEIRLITSAIGSHSSPSGGGVVGEILRDADKLDALGVRWELCERLHPSVQSQNMPQTMSKGIRGECQ